MQEKLNELLRKKDLVHNKAEQIIIDTKEQGKIIPSMLKNEYNNKVSQYNEMYDNVETMKSLTTNSETFDNLLKQQIEILTVRITWELDWMKRAISHLS
jgi:hypothetical protein